MTSKLSEKLGAQKRKGAASKKAAAESFARQAIHQGDLISFTGHYVEFGENFDTSVLEVTPTRGLVINVSGSLVTVCTNSNFCLINCAHDDVDWHIVSSDE